MKSSRREFLGAAAGLALAGSTKPEKIHAANAGTNQIVNIYDNIVYEAGDAIPDWGFSAYITYNGKTILFDAGTYPEIFKHNTTVFGVDLVAVDTVILSHNHMDHKGGLDYFLDAYEDYTLYLPNEWNIGGPFPTIFKKDGTYARGYSYRHRNTQYVIEHTEISNGIHIIATESPIIGTSWGYPPHEEKPLFMGLPELSLALENGTGQVILIS
ncbi:MAG: MBL fold metallo-hydrolase, partial [Candidatus Latescibacteria bacterium]|nr:MBL fold metallo-hydrolase [Candidatus Latescibacterota bacterium]